MEFKFNTKVGGIPCVCKVTKEDPFTFRIIGTKGNSPVAWLEKKVSEADRIRLVEEFQFTKLEIKHGHAQPNEGYVHPFLNPKQVDTV